ncbi:MAG: hypothetical protein A2287_00065 [Candidatus Melainabacteria bacterium RIFOXYA12_FULL_32_12]|nr:MAG: hypothetical protein A2255_10815 [Candidatus Melainabacteria bacterium RIFOXYA2_FULL_32_9]OGI31808.1 MAG: hypothetical protein A2287_00065 [Candidatus Melainabacteria bacterium RIFOXYA12_FULL_32_12]
MPIPIFDCLTHPTLDGNWINNKYPNKNCVESIVIEMQENNIIGAFAVGMKNIGNYNIDTYADFIRSKSTSLYPVAYFDFEEIKDNNSISIYLKFIKQKGYIGIKIHPRFSRISLENEYLEYIIKQANELKLVVMICTYFESKGFSDQNNLITLRKFLQKIDNQKIILLHSGTIHLLEMMQIAKNFENVILDLSYTLCKYEGSSVDLDINYLFKNFDKRICVGSDSPEITLNQLRKRFEFFSEKIKIEKAENIAFRNILNFTDLET